MCALLLGAISNRGAQTDQSGLVLLLLCLDNGIVNALQVTEEWLNHIEHSYAPGNVLVTVVNVQDLPAICQEPLLDILGERDSSIAINRDI